MTRAVTFGAVALVLTLGVGPTLAASGDISVSTSTQSEVTPSENVSVPFEVTNDGDESTNALGLRITSLPSDFAVVGIESSGAVAADRNAVFWTDPVQPGESVSAVFVVRVTDAAEPGDRAIRAMAATNETERQTTAQLSVRSQAERTQTATPTATATSPSTTVGSGGGGTGVVEGSGELPTITPTRAVAALAVVLVLLKLW